MRSCSAMRYCYPGMVFSLLLACLTAVVSAQSASRQAGQLLADARYDELDALYAKVAAGPFAITDSRPELTDYFKGFFPSETKSEAEWQKRREALERWVEARPESVPARLAQVAFYQEHAWKARGQGYSSTVSEEGWKLFAERRDRALELLAAAPEAARTALYGIYLEAYIKAPEGKYLEEVRWLADRMTGIEPGFGPAYSLVGNYLLPRWFGEPGDLARYAAEAADKLGGADGDILYAQLLGWAAYCEEDKFVSLHRPDYARMVRGYEAWLEKTPAAKRFPIQSRFCYAAGLTGDWKRARQLLGEIGPVASFGNWNGRENYGVWLEKSGLRQEFVSIEIIEQQGRLDEAEKRYAELARDRASNRWLTLFYLSHGLAREYAGSAGARDMAAPVDSIRSMDEVAEQCRVSIALRDFPRARALAMKFDRSRPHNLIGKITLYEAALLEGDAAAAGQAREAIVALKTNRKAYRVAQEVLSGKRSAADVKPGDFDWKSDQYASQGATACALRLYEIGEPAAATALLDAALRREGGYLEEAGRLRALVLHPPGSSPLLSEAAVEAGPNAKAVTAGSGG